MAPRANWKGFLRLSLVTCPVALFPATSDSEKISFNQINRNTGHRIKYMKVDADTGEEVSSDDIMKGYKVDTDTYIEISKDELDNIALESTRTIEIDQFVPKSEIDELYLVRPYYIVPDGKVGHDAYAVIRETIRSLDKVALARVVLTNREHVIALEARDNGLMGMLLRYPYEVRNSAEYFDDIQDVKITKDMLDLAKHIVRAEVRPFRSGKIRGSLRGGADRIDQQEAQRRAHHLGVEAGVERQCHQPDGRAEAQHFRQARGGREGGGCAKGREGQEAAQGSRRPARNAAADRRQARRQGGRKTRAEGSQGEGARKESGLGPRHSGSSSPRSRGTQVTSGIAGSTPSCRASRDP